jgi:hypothetical protein
MLTDDDDGGSRTVMKNKLFFRGKLFSPRNCGCDNYEELGTHYANEKFMIIVIKRHDEVF